MEDDPISLSGDLSGDVRVFRDRFRASDNADVIIRRFRSGAFFSALVTIDGMTDTREIDENILKPCMALPHDAGADVPPEARVGYLMENAVSVLPTETKSRFDELIADALSGQSVLLCDGCACACVMDTRGFEKRAVGRPEAEQVVLGPHESFGESIRTNITLLRRIVQREELMTEFLSVGGAMKTRCALLYLRGTADEAMLARIRRRLAACQSDFALSAGEIGQIIEDHPMALIPQCVATERPDRAASFLAEGQIVVLTDGSPLALGAPSTLWHQLHTPDDASMRWQYGTFLRIVRFIGMLIHLFLPGAYIAVLRFHTELISPILLASVYETSSRVPAPIFLEALLMTLAFDLVSEAGLRAPGAMGNALGIVSGLILGQSAVGADIVSPLLLIVVAASGLGGFCIPNYALSVGMKIIQLLFLTAGALGKITQVSESTVVRFAAELGYDGYPAMQRALQEMVLNRLTSVQRIEVTDERLGEQDVVSTILQADMDRLRHTNEHLDREAFSGAVEALLQARCIYVLGVRSSAALASSLSYYLHYMFENVRLITTPSTSEVFEQLVRISPQDAVIGISFPRYSTATGKALQYCREAGAQVIALTDSETAPIARSAHYLLTAKSDMVSLVDSLVAPMSVVNALIVALTSRRKHETAQTLDRLEQVWDQYHVYEKVHI